MKVFIINGYGYENLFLKYGHEVVSELLDADLCVFTGGEDVSPIYYGEKKHPRTYNNQLRDVEEQAYFNICITKEIPCVGICRGGQFLNCLSGGKMYQHVEKHTQSHAITDIETGRKIYASSTHHQMMRGGSGSIVVATAKQNGIKEYMKDNAIIRDPVDDLDTEVLFYPLTKCLCFQPHPEFFSEDFFPLQEYFFELIQRYLVKE